MQRDYEASKSCVIGKACHFMVGCQRRLVARANGHLLTLVT